jgi:hypothetical protein
MSTFQPPGGQQQPPAPPAFVPPQDPWGGGFEQGVASVPTDPIPQQQFDQYAQPPAGGDVWSQQTVAHGGQYPQAPKQRGRGGAIAVVILAILVLGGGGGYAAYYVVKQHGTTTTTTTTATTPPTRLDLSKVVQGDCIMNVGTATAPVMQSTACTTANSFKVLRVMRGATIPRAADGSLDRNTTSPQVCAGLQYDNYYAFWEDDDRTKDVFLCLAANGAATTSPTGS